MDGYDLTDAGAASHRAVSGKEGLRLQFHPIDDMLYDVTGTRTLQIRLLGCPKIATAPGPFGGRGEMGMGAQPS